MSNILVTGSNGYLGSRLVPYLMSEGHNLFGIDTGFFSESVLYHNKNKTSYKFFNIDIRDIEDKHLEQIDCVIHLAGISNDPMGKMESAKVYDPTRKYSFDLAKKCKSRGIRFIFASSCSVYGIGTNQLLDEESNVNPQTGYSLNKYQIETDLRDLADKNFSPIALRFATVFGLSPRIRFDLVINMLVGMAVVDKKIVLNSDGQSWRPNLHIDDLCQSIKCAVDSNYDEGKLLVLNVGDEMNNKKIIDIAKEIKSTVNATELSFLSDDPSLDKDGLIRDRKVSGKDIRTYKVSFSKIKDYFPSFECKWTIKKGIEIMANKFESINLNSTLFKDKGFYRLQQLEHLLVTNQISDQLRWIS